MFSHIIHILKLFSRFFSIIFKHKGIQNWILQLALVSINLLYSGKETGENFHSSPLYGKLRDPPHAPLLNVEHELSERHTWEI